MAFESLLKAVSDYYTARLAEFGSTPKGVDWNGEASQRTRFEQLLKVLVPEAGRPVSLVEFGCGYGALVDVLAARGGTFRYVGFDISTAMVDAARQRYGARPDCQFVGSLAGLPPADYAVASGIFNVKMAHGVAAWETYVKATLDDLAAACTRGFAFNMLTSYSDADRMRPDLYYADPLAYFDFCKRRYARNVALLHDYDLYEFTLVVRKA